MLKETAIIAEERDVQRRSQYGDNSERRTWETLTEISAKTESNAEQLAKLAVQISKLADQVSQLTAALQVSMVDRQQLNERMKHLESRKERETEQYANNIIGFRNDVIGWIILILIAIFTAVASGFIHFGK